MTQYKGTSQCQWVCFNCRVGVRRSLYSEKVLCSHCGKACECLGKRVALPAKTKDKEWQELRVWYYQREAAVRERRKESAFRKIQIAQGAIDQLHQETQTAESMFEIMYQQAVVEYHKKLMLPNIAFVEKEWSELSARINQFNANLYPIINKKLGWRELNSTLLDLDEMYYCVFRGRYMFVREVGKVLLQNLIIPLGDSLKSGVTPTGVSFEIISERFNWLICCNGSDVALRKKAIT